ncbi:MAG: hypothetical protein QM731_07885 [Chitinophagaceae bacterium]
MEKKLYDPVTHAQAIRWRPVTTLVINETEKIIKSVRELKSNVDKVSITGNDKMLDGWLNEREREEFVNKIMEYQQAVQQGVDSVVMDSVSRKWLLLDLQQIKGTLLVWAERNRIEKVVRSLLEQTDWTSTKLILAKIENDILIAETKLIKIFNRQIASYTYGMVEKYSVVATQNSSVLKKGGILEITAGVGTFTTPDSAQILINGKKFPFNSENVVVYRKRLNASPGSYSIPVKIRLMRLDSSLIWLNKEIKYTVIE